MYPYYRRINRETMIEEMLSRCSDFGLSTKVAVSSKTIFLFVNFVGRVIVKPNPDISITGGQKPNPNTSIKGSRGSGWIAFCFRGCAGLSENAWIFPVSKDV
jgi:hypothetical protein